MKIAAIIGAAALVVLVLLGSVLYGMRWFSQATTPVTVIEPEPGIHCALAVTTDGAAIDCWKVEPRCSDWSEPAISDEGLALRAQACEP